MINLNFYLVFGTAILPLLIGFLWYNDAAFGKLWKKENGFPEDNKPTGTVKIFIATYILGLFLSVAMYPITIHQMGLYSMLEGNPDLANPASELSTIVSGLMAKYGSNFRSFKHGALHGVIMGLFFALPVISINALFENKSWKYIGIHIGYWLLTLGLMGGIICQWA